MSLSKQGKGILPIFQAAQYYPPVLKKQSNKIHDGKSTKFVAKRVECRGRGMDGVDTMDRVYPEM